MKTKKRRKSSRMRGSHTHGRGFKKKARGSGHRGGKGMAGTGKRADHKKTLILNLYGNDYFGKDKALRKKPKRVLESINISKINQQLNLFLKVKQAHKDKDVININLKGYKILSNGTPENKYVIVASAASKLAIDKIKKSGGNIIIENKEN